MWKVAEYQHFPILMERGWEVEVVPLVAGQRSVKEKEWLESFEIFGNRIRVDSGLYKWGSALTIFLPLAQFYGTL